MLVRDELIHVSKAAKRGAPGIQRGSAPATQPSNPAPWYSMTIGSAGP